MPRRSFPSAAAAVALLAVSVAAPAHAVSRGDAASTVINTIIIGHPQEEQIMAFGPQAVIQAGEVVADGYDVDPVGTAPSVCWFFWIDPFPLSRFEHPTEFVLVDTLSGTVVLHEEGRYWARVGGGDLYRDSDERSLLNPDLIYSGPDAAPLTPDRQAEVEFFEFPLTPNAPDPSAGKWAVVIVGENTATNPDFKADRDTTLAVLKGPLGIPNDNITLVENKSKTDVCNAIAGLPADCPKLYVVVIAHGGRGRFSSHGDRIQAAEFASKLKGRNAGEYCAVLAQCFSGTFLPALRDSGLSGFHMTSAGDTTCHALQNPTAKFPWRGEVFLHYWAHCLRSGKRGQDAYRCARDSVGAFLARVFKSGTVPHNPGPKSSQVFVNTTSGQKTTIEVPAGTGTVCINWKPGPTTTCGNVSLYCQVVVAPGDTTWKMVKHWNWNVGQSRYFNPFGAPNATGKYQLVSHSNGYPVCGDITFSDVNLGESVTSPPIFPAYSVGWTDFSNLEFAQPPLPPPPLPPVPIQTELLQLDLVAPSIGQIGTANFDLQMQFPLQPDPDRPWLYPSGDPLQGFDGNIRMQIEASGLFDPFGIPVPNLDIQFLIFQGLGSGSATLPAVQTPDGFEVEPVNVSGLLPQPFQVRLSVPGSGASEGIGGGYFALDAFHITTTPFAVLGVPKISLQKAIVTRLEMAQPSPNPFTQATRILLAMPHESRLRLAVYDLSGRRVRSLADGTFGAGEHGFDWDGRDTKGHLAPIGAYFVRAEIDGQEASRKIVRMQ